MHRGSVVSDDALRDPTARKAVGPPSVMTSTQNRQGAEDAQSESPVFQRVPSGLPLNGTGWMGSLFW